MAQPCPDDDRLVAFVEGLLSDADRAQMEAHLAGCPDCSAVAGAVFESPTSPSPTKIGRYEIRGEVGRGGMGRVLEAYDPALDRAVAIKLLLPSALSAIARERLIREAEALGSMRHPNVIEVFDVGDIEGAPYFVMELIEGSNLAQWCRGRDVRTVLGCLRAAGRGLAVAHAKGVLHRDFKPSNVLVGHDGRPRVGDFGLAGFCAAQTERSGEVSGGSLTKTGAVMGTLPYMAPELLDGGEASVASDQFAFCVSMYEVLHGTRPFRGTDARSLGAAIRAGEMREPPAEVQLPARVRAVLQRGLSPLPSDRFASMDALLAALHPGGQVRAAAAVGLVGLATVAVVATSPPRAPCTASARQLEANYDPSTRATLRDRFERTEAPNAEAAARSTIAALDAYADTWREGARTTCTAWDRGELTDTALDLRMHCLKKARRSFASTVERLGAASKGDVAQAPELVGALPDVGLCSDTEALQRLVVLPADAAQAAEHETLGPVLADVRALIVLDDYDGAWAVLEEHTVELSKATYPPIALGSRMARARILLGRKAFEDAKPLLLEVHNEATEHRLDRDAARSAVLLGLVAAGLGFPDDARRWFALALARARASGHRAVEAQALLAESNIHATAGDLGRAVSLARRAVATVEHDESYSPVARAELLAGLSLHLFEQGGAEDGLEELLRAQRILQGLHGDTHLALGEIEHNLQLRASRRGDYDASLRHAQEALRITLAIHGRASFNVLAGHVNVGIALYELGRFEEAAARYQLAEALLDELPASAQPAKVAILVNLANVFLALKRTEDARAATTRASATMQQRPDQKKRIALLDGVLANVELQAGNVRAARRLAERSLEATEAIFGTEHARTADSWTRLARIELASNAYAPARALLEKALSVEDATEADRGEALFLLARALVEDPTQNPDSRATGLRLAAQASEALASKPASAQRRREVLKWLEEV